MVQAAFFLVAWRTVSANEHVRERRRGPRLFCAAAGDEAERAEDDDDGHVGVDVRQRRADVAALDLPARHLDAFHDRDILDRGANLLKRGLSAEAGGGCRASTRRAARCRSPSPLSMPTHAPQRAEPRRAPRTARKRDA